MAENIKKLTMRNCCIDEDGQTDEPIIKKLNEVIDFINLIEAAPVRHEKWEVVIGSDGKERMICTGCRKQQDLTGIFSYCPNCGAKMDGGK